MSVICSGKPRGVACEASERHLFVFCRVLSRIAHHNVFAQYQNSQNWRSRVWIFFSRLPTRRSVVRRITYGERKFQRKIIRVAASNEIHRSKFNKSNKYKCCFIVCCRRYRFAENGSHIILSAPILYLHARNSIYCVLHASRAANEAQVVINNNFFAGWKYAIQQWHSFLVSVLMTRFLDTVEIFFRSYWKNKLGVISHFRSRLKKKTRDDGRSLPCAVRILDRVTIKNFALIEQFHLREP